ncbi:hypothetical protein BGW80DRAFT_1455397 [Lactifluus volemus]|nr:hypothetical protein BGW80DRAFT_1455397 [Lactifluus volemus]
MSTFDGVYGTVCNAQQYMQSIPLVSNPHPSVSCLSRGQCIGLALTAEASFISLFSVVVAFILIGRNVRRYRKELPNGDWKLLKLPADIYMLSLFVFDIFHAFGGILDVRWAHVGIVTLGPYCSTQGILMQFGELGLTLITLILATHTFISALWGVGREACMLAFGLVGFTCVFTVLWVSLGNGLHRDYEAPTPFWCWINSQYNADRLAGEYFWMWFALFASVVMYITLYFWAQGRLSVDEEKWYKFHLKKSDDSLKRPERRHALRLLFYPLSYSLVILTLSLARWTLYKDTDVPSAATFFGVSMLNLSGAINVLLLLVVRPRLLLFVPPAKLYTVGTRVESSRPATAPSISNGSKDDQSLSPTVIDDLEGRSWEPPSECPTNSFGLSPIRPRTK